MKTIALILIFVLHLFLFNDNKVLAQQELTNYELKPGEKIAFCDCPKEKGGKRSGGLDKGSFDGSKYHFKYSQSGEFVVSGVRGAKGKKQNELLLFNCNGNISRYNDTLQIQLKSNASALFLISVNQNTVLDQFKDSVEIRLVTVTLDNTYCPGLIDNTGFTLIHALPSHVDPEERYKSHHADKTIGIFSYFEITDKDKNTKTYPAGEYILLGGNKLLYKRK